MKIILTETLENIGKAGQILTVKDGFARNYLLPKKYAIIATAANLKKISDIEAEAKAKADKKNAELRILADKIETLTAHFSRRAEADGKLFGSVAEIDIVQFLAENDIHCPKSAVVLEKHIKTLGEYEVKIAFTSEISANLKIVITDSE